MPQRRALLYSLFIRDSARLLALRGAREDNGLLEDMIGEDEMLQRIALEYATR